jgi:uncharacterized protein YceH (UPF0502 family)
VVRQHRRISILAIPDHDAGKLVDGYRLFIAIIVNAMHSFTEQESQERQEALDQTRDHIEADLHQEVASLRSEIAELKQLLQESPNR